tara:strand:+ start:146 stop:349 length:204 start_codon:yes stop_codon:yes gene_type:complete
MSLRHILATKDIPREKIKFNGLQTIFSKFTFIYFSKIAKNCNNPPPSAPKANTVYISFHKTLLVVRN